MAGIFISCFPIFSPNMSGISAFTDYNKMHNHNMTFIFKCITLGIMRETRHSADNTSVA